jgi:type I restriction enzyme, R subunit
MSNFTEAIVEDAPLFWLEVLGYAVLHLPAPQSIVSRQASGPDIAQGDSDAERSDPSYRDVVLDGRLRQAVLRPNTGLPYTALEDAYRKLMRGDAPLLVERNRALHLMLVDGITVEHRRKGGSIARNPLPVP